MNDYYDGPPAPQNDHDVTLNAEVHVEWNNANVLKQVIEQVSDRIYNDIKAEADEAVRFALDDLANTAIMETFDSEVQPTDKWGKPVESPVNVRALLQRDAEQWLMDRVDNSGRMGRDSYGNVQPRIHWLFEEVLKGKKDRRGTTQLQKMVVKAVKSTIGDVEAIVNKTVHEAVKVAVSK